MATATLASPTCPQPRHWTREEFYRLAEHGFFTGQRAELIEGTIVVLSPQSPAHVFAVDRAYRTLSAVFGHRYWVRARFPLSVGQASEPEPDVSVVRGDPGQYLQGHPRHAVLAVEVSDSTLSYDRRHKGSLYSRAGMDDY